jgi:glycerophosphoryl diester phosphodiesterase
LIELLRGDRAVLRIGHRGAAALGPENSLEAIEAAARCGADAVEVDVVQGLRVTHDRRAAATGPPLDAVLELVAALGLAVQIDVKEQGLGAGVAAALERHGLGERSFMSASDRAVLREFAAVAPGVLRSLTYPADRLGLGGRPDAAPLVRAGLALHRAVLPARLPALLRAVGAGAATLDHRVVSRAAIAAAHAQGAAVLAWTVNEPARANILVESGIDAIITDDPRIVPASITDT